MARIPTHWTVEQSSYLRWAEQRQGMPNRRLPVGNGPRISVVMPVFNTRLEWLRAALESVVSQEYRNWQLCIADDGSTEPWVAPELRRWADSDSRVSVRSLGRNVGIAGASNAALQMAEGEFVALMDHDDVLPPHALGTVAAALEDAPDAQLVYTDSDHLDERGERCSPFFKPDWDHVRFLGQNFLNHLTVIRADVLEQANGWTEGYEGSQDYDLYLRVLEIVDADQVLHIPEILYHWRDSPNSKARGDLAGAVRAARRAIKHHLERVGAVADVKSAPSAGLFNRIRWRLTDPPAELLVLLSGHDAAQLSAAARRVEAVDPEFPLSIRTHDRSSTESTLGSFVNQSLRAGSAATVLVLNADLVVQTDEWLDDLLALAHLPGTGVVGAMCSTAAGYVYAFPRFRDRLPRRAVGPRNAHEVGATDASSGYIANLALDQSVDFVSPDVMAFRRDVFDGVGGFVEELDEERAAEAFCRAAAKQGLRNVWTPHVRFRLGPPDAARADGGSIVARSPELPPEILPKVLSDHELLAWDIEWAERGDR